jgi:thiopurine S-methyltransferase
MEASFWINAWNEGRTNFHLEVYHEKLLQYFPELNPKQGQSVLVPLCGKTKDLLWLHGQGLHVHGVELYDHAVEAFFTENKLSPMKKTQDKDFSKYAFENITVSCGDFFKLSANETYDFVYDRAALVALPLEMRKNYAQVIKQSLKKGGKCLLIVYEYDQTKMDGPPFSVDANEIHELYEDQCTVKLIEEKRPNNEGPRLGALDNLIQKIYILEKL